VSEPLFGADEERNLVDCVRSGWLSSEGPYVAKLEALCAEQCLVKEGVAVCNGTAALQIALKCLPLEPGDEVIMPAFTIISCATAVIEAGAVPVLVDCEPWIWTMDVGAIEAKITHKTKAIMAVHMYGHPVDMDPVLKIASKHGLYVIEDCAEGHGSRYKGRQCGGLSDISILSFYANKLVTTGEGGMVLTSNPAFADRARSLRNLCFREDRRFIHDEIGHNYRMSNLQAAVGVAQMARLESFVGRKREMALLYDELLSGLPLSLPYEMAWARSNYWMYAIVLDDIGMDADRFMSELRKREVDSRPFFIGMHEQPVFKSMGLFKNEAYPMCETISRLGLYLPSGQAITDDQIRRSAEAVADVFSAHQLK
jgi:perosamine synthetase